MPTFKFANRDVVNLEQKDEKDLLKIMNRVRKEWTDVQHLHDLLKELDRIELELSKQKDFQARRSLISGAKHTIDKAEELALQLVYEEKAIVKLGRRLQNSLRIIDNLVKKQE